MKAKKIGRPLKGKKVASVVVSVRIEPGEKKLLEKEFGTAGMGINALIKVFLKAFK